MKYILIFLAILGVFWVNGRVKEYRELRHDECVRNAAREAEYRLDSQPDALNSRILQSDLSSC